MTSQLLGVGLGLLLLGLAAWTALRQVRRARAAAVRDAAAGAVPPPARLPRRLWVYALLALLLVLLPLWSGPRPWQARFQGSAAELGKQMGDKFGLHMRLLLRLYIRGVVCNGDEAAFAAACRRAVTGYGGLAQAYRDELAASAAAAGVDADALLLANSFLDMGLFAAGCRSIVSTRGPGLLHGHNLDWDNLAGLGTWTTSLVRRRPADGRHATVSVAFPGMVGSLDIINEHGVALSFNQLGGTGHGAGGEPVFITLRRIAETCADFRAAREQILQMPPGMPFTITLSAAKSRESAVFQRTGGPVEERPAAAGLLTADNAEDGFDPAASQVYQAVSGLDVSSVAGMQAAFRHPDVLQACNIWSVILDDRGNRLHLASGRAPAAQYNYREYPLF